MDRNENVYVADVASYGVAKFDRTAKFVRRFNFLASGQMPTGIAVDASGNVFVAEVGNSRIVKFDMLGR